MNKQIWVIDDDESILSLLERILNQIPNVQVIPERNGKRALERLQSCTPDLIILDIEMPEMNGIDVCKELRKRDVFKSVPIMAVSGHVGIISDEILFNAGFTELLPKPFKLREFLALVKKHVDP